VRDALDQRLVQFVALAGLVPIPVPNGLGEDGRDGSSVQAWLRAINPGALILSGGNDVGEYPERDDTERCVLSWAEAKRVPVLGICRGLQMMAVWGGVHLVRREGHVRTRHCLKVETAAGEWPTDVNSFHNWVIASCPAGYEITARAEDDSIEAIKHTALPWEGWMWHPERETPFSTQDLNRLKRLFRGR
jgi:putative glutamine amidotransferase